MSLANQRENDVVREIEIRSETATVTEIGISLADTDLVIGE